MKSGLTSTRVGEWLSGRGRDADIVISSRIRLARNVAGIPFLVRATREEQKELVRHVNSAIVDALAANGSGVVMMDDLSPLEAQFLLERHLISPHFAESIAERGFYVSTDETLSLMINEEDHLRLQVLGSGLCLSELRQKITEVDSALNSRLPYAYHDQFGFLTACPTNVGTGMRTSILIHLPGVVLTKEINRVLRGIAQLGLSVRGTYGEGTETKGYLFQVSNQRTLGQSEEEIVETLSHMADQIIRYERDAREYLFSKMGTYIDDKVYRSLGILKYARVLTSDETINLLSTLRLGVSRLKGLEIGKLNRLMIATQPANLQLYYGKDLEPEERDRKRPEMIRETLRDVQT